MLDPKKPSCSVHPIVIWWPVFFPLLTGSRNQSLNIITWHDRMVLTHFFFIFFNEKCLMLILLQMSLIPPPLLTSTYPRLPLPWPSTHYCPCLWGMHLCHLGNPFTLFIQSPHLSPLWHSPVCFRYLCFWFHFVDPILILLPPLPPRPAPSAVVCFMKAELITHQHGTTPMSSWHRNIVYLTIMHKNGS